MMTTAKTGLFFLSIFLANVASAKPGQQSLRPVIAITDTLSHNDSLSLPGDAVTSDPKQGFRELFVENTAGGSGLNTQQLNPLAVSFVEDYIDKYGKSMEAMKDWGKPYFDLMDNVLVQHGLPKELKYLAVIESNLKSNARSWVGAVGPWQFMPVTARNMGLKVGRHYDERTDYLKSTHAACRYLADLYGIYNDWLLVIAAYNGGPGNVNAAIRKSGSRDFWVLQNYLPAESRNHVKKFIATHYIMEGQGGPTTGLTSESTAPGNQLSKTELDSSSTQSISGRYRSIVILKYISFDPVAFARFNPDFDKQIGSFGVYLLRLPTDKMELFTQHKTAILDESMQLLLNAGN